jgi:hypothetical protein
VWITGALTGLAAASGTGFLVLADVPAILFGTVALGLAFAGGLMLGIAPSWDRAHRVGGVLAGMTPLVLLAPLPLGVMAVRGPDYFWYLFWSSGAFRTAVLGVTLAVVLATILLSHRVAATVTARENRAAAGTVLATGVGLVLLAALLPDLEGTLSALDDPLGIVPMTHAIINAVTHYGGMPDWILWTPGMLGVVLVAGGVISRWRGNSPDPT